MVCSLCEIPLSGPSPSGYIGIELQNEAAIEESERAWGLMPGARYAAITERTVERDYVPRFARLGIDLAAAWRRARI